MNDVQPSPSTTALARWQHCAQALRDMLRWHDPSPQVVQLWKQITTTGLIAATLFAVAVVGYTWHGYLSTEGYVDYVEGLVLFHQTQAAAGANIYDPSFREAPPYSVPLYGPSWYYLIAPLLGDEPSLFPGRAGALVCMLGLGATALLVLRRKFLADWPVCGAAAIVWMTTIGTLQFGINNRVDALACMLGVLAVVVSTLRFRASWCVVVLLLVGAAFTKATAVVAPSLAVFCYLLGERRWREASAISLLALVLAAGILLVGDHWTTGNFSRCLIFSNVNPFKLSQAVTLLKSVCKQPVLPVGVLLAALLITDRRARPFALFGVISFLFAVLSSAKVGSNTNYFIEPSWAAAMCLGIALARMQGHVRAPIALGVLALLVVHSAARGVSHTQYLDETLREWPMVQHAVASYGRRGPLLTMEIGAQVRAGQQPYVADAHIITRLTEAGQFHQESVLNDLRQQRLAALILGEDALVGYHGHTNWTHEMRLAIAQYYRPHEVLGRLTVYLPRSVPLSDESLQARLPQTNDKAGLVRVSKFHPNGCLSETSDYFDGKLHGTQTLWDESGSKWCELHYEAGQLEGTQRYFRENGQVARELTYVDGLRHGVEQHFGADGSCLETVLWSHGVPSTVGKAAYVADARNRR